MVNVVGVLVGVAVGVAGAWIGSRAIRLNPGLVPSSTWLGPSSTVRTSLYNLNTGLRAGRLQRPYPTGNDTTATGHGLTPHTAESQSSHEHYDWDT